MNPTIGAHPRLPSPPSPTPAASSLPSTSTCILSVPSVAARGYATPLVLVSKFPCKDRPAATAFAPVRLYSCLHRHILHNSYPPYYPNTVSTPVPSSSPQARLVPYASISLQSSFAPTTLANIAKSSTRQNPPLQYLATLAACSKPDSSKFPQMSSAHPTAAYLPLLPYRSRCAIPSSSSSSSNVTEAYNDWLGTLRAAGATLHDARVVLEHMAEAKTPYNEATFTHLIAICARSADAPAAAQFLHQMRLQGLSISTTTYASFFATCARSNNLALARTAWHQMINVDSLSPTDRACGAFVDCLARAGLADEANVILDEYPFADNIVSRTSIVSGLARAGLVDEALAAFYDMIDRGLAPNVLAYTALTHALGKLKRVDDAIHILNQAIEHNIDTDELLFESVICACGAAGDVERAFQILYIMQRSGWKLSDRGYEGLIYACGTSKNARRALVVFQAATEAGKDSGRVLSAVASAILQAGISSSVADEILAKMRAFATGKSPEGMKRLGVNPFRFEKKMNDLKRLIKGKRGRRSL